MKKCHGQEEFRIQCTFLLRCPTGSSNLSCLNKLLFLNYHHPNPKPNPLPESGATNRLRKKPGVISDSTHYSSFRDVLLSIDCSPHKFQHYDFSNSASFHYHRLPHYLDDHHFLSSSHFLQETFPNRYIWIRFSNCLFTGL